MKSVDSTNLKSVGYENNVLRVCFLKSGACYEYYSVPEEVYFELMNASSHGQYFNRNIRNKYSYKKV